MIEWLIDIFTFTLKGFIIMTFAIAFISQIKK
jgi:hypothetical protein